MEVYGVADRFRFCMNFSHPAHSPSDYSGDILSSYYSLWVNPTPPDTLDRTKVFYRTPFRQHKYPKLPVADSYGDDPVRIEKWVGLHSEWKIDARDHTVLVKSPSKAQEKLEKEQSHKETEERAALSRRSRGEGAEKRKQGTEDRRKLEKMRK